MSSIEVIELGEDGSFDISTSPVKQQKMEDIDYSTYTWEDTELQAQTSILDELQPKEYVTYRDQNDYIIITKLASGSTLRGVGYGSNEVYIETLEYGQEVTLKIPLPEKVIISEDSVQCKYYQEFVTIKFIAK